MFTSSRRTTTTEQSNHQGQKKMEKHSEIYGRLMLVPSPLQGHLNPMLQLAAALHSKGFSITIAHSQSISLNNPSFDPPEFTFFPIPDGSSSRDNASSSRGPFFDLMALNINSEVPLREKLREMRQYDDHRVACVIYDPVMYIVERVVHDLKISSIVLETLPAAALVANAAYPRLESYIPVKDSISQELLPGHPPFRFKDLLIYDLQNNESALQIIAKMREIKTFSAYVLNTMDCLEQAYLSKFKQLKQPIPVFALGPLHKISKGYPSSTSLYKEDTSCITWLDKQESNSVIYVSTGSLSTTDEKELVETAWGLANSKQSFLWVIQPGSVTKTNNGMSLLPESFKQVIEERGCVVEWAPQKEVLAHPAVGGFWSHCGWNSTLESVCHGVPMICWPRFGDQRMNARYVSYVWRVGLELEKMEREEIAATVRKLMADNEGVDMRERALNLKMQIEAAVGKGGSSYNSLNNLVEFVLSL